VTDEVERTPEQAAAIGKAAGAFELFVASMIDGQAAGLEPAEVLRAVGIEVPGMLVPALNAQLRKLTEQPEPEPAPA
jgi:hypothetical protein